VLLVNKVRSYSRAVAAMIRSKARELTRLLGFVMFLSSEHSARPLQQIEDKNAFCKGLELALGFFRMRATHHPLERFQVGDDTNGDAFFSYPKVSCS
jgi:hypothetical protein